MELAVIIWLLSIILGTIIGNKKGEGCISFGMTVLLGPFWLPVILLSKGNRRKCPFCAEDIHKEAKICPFCKKETGFNH